MPRRSHTGSAHVAIVMVLLVMAVFGTAGYVVYAADKDKVIGREQAAQQKAADEAEQASKDAVRQKTPSTDKEFIEAAQLAYCRTDYKRFWEATYSKTIDPVSVTSSYDESVKDPFVISDDRALVRAAKCDTTALTDLQKFAPFMLYFKKTDGSWQAYERYQTTPPCDRFDDGSWPLAVVPTCNDNGAERAPKQKEA